MNEAVNIKELNEKIKAESEFVDLIKMEMQKVIVGQKHLMERLLIGLLSDGHVLLEGVPGLAKTLAVKTLADTIDARFSRIGIGRGRCAAQGQAGCRQSAPL